MNGLQEVHFLIVRRHLVIFAFLAPLRPPHCSASFRLFGDLLGYSIFYWSPTLSWMLRTSLLGAFLAIRRTPRCPASSWLLGPPWLLCVILATQCPSALPYSYLAIFSVCPSPLACRCSPWPSWSWSLPALVAARWHPSGWHVLGTYLIVW